MKAIKKEKTFLKKYKYLSLFILFSLILFLTKNIWFSKDVIVFSDIDFGLDDKVFILRIFSLFNEHFSSMNFFNLSRLAFIIPFYLLALLFSNFIPGFLLKVIIVFVLLISAMGMFCLCEKLLEKHFGNFNKAFHYFGLIIPALYYAINPWVMFRIQHIFLLPGYACYPWILYFFIDLFKLYEDEEMTANKEATIEFTIFKKTIKLKETIWKDIISAIKIAFFILIGSASIHYFFFYILTIVGLGLFILVHNIRKSHSFKSSFYTFIRRNIILWSIVFLFCAYWIIPYLFAMFQTNIEPNNVNVVNTLGMFSRNSDIRNILYLVSYWWPMFDTTTYLDGLFWIGGGVFLFFAVYIILYRFKQHFYISLFTFTTLFMIALATGVNSNYLDNFNIFVVTNIPIFGHIFRDPNKLVGPMAAFFAILIGFGVDRYLFLINREGFSKWAQGFFILVLLISHNFYYRPFKTVFTDVYYSGAELPKEYEIVNKNHIEGEGKVIWFPCMEHMLLSNKISNYAWNMPKDNDNELNLMRVVGNFHQYSSSKAFIFQHENNDGTIPYFYSLFQHLLDKTGGQHFGELINHMGFDELAFHNDVYGQEERQEFNLEVLNNQDSIEKYYEDNIFTLYKTKNPQEKNLAVNKILYHTDNMFSYLYMLDKAEELGVNSDDTGIIWSQARKQDFNLDESDIIVGDNKWDIIMPFLDNEYFYYPFDYVNTGDPYQGWAKTLLKDSEWQWLLSLNGLNNAFEYDYSHGIAYTSVSHKLNVPDYKLEQYSNNIILDTNDVLEDFFMIEDTDVFNLTVFPEYYEEDGVLYGHILKGTSANNIWQVASSKELDISGLKSGFIRLKAVVSGVNAGSLHFKVRFFDNQGQEIAVNYLSKSDEFTDFKMSELVCDAYIPQDAETMSISILAMQDIIKDTYFWVHSFRAYDISGYTSQNTLKIPIKNKAKDNKYRVLIRAFFSPISSSFTIDGGKESLEVNLNHTNSKFNWIDIGEMHITDALKIIPKDGFVAINSIAVIAADEFDLVYSKLNDFKGSQGDFSLIHHDYEIKTDFTVDNLKDIRLFPNTIDGNLTCLTEGELTKTLDIIKEGNYTFSFTGNIPRQSEIIVSLINQARGEKYILENRNVNDIKRNFHDKYYKIRDEKDKYFISIEDDLSNAWEIKNYSYAPIFLEPGQYEILIEVKGNVINNIELNSLHLIKEDELVIPPELVEESGDIIVRASDIVIVTEQRTKDRPYFTNNKTNSKLWMVYALNKVKVTKGDLIAFKAKVDAKGLQDIHGKLLWLDKDNILTDNTYITFNNNTNELYILCEAPEDGYIIPTFLARGTPKEDGIFGVESAELYFLDHFTKIEGTSLTPEITDETEKAIISKGLFGKTTIKNARYLINNEAYNPTWRFVGIGAEESVPISMNFIHNGFKLKGTEAVGFISINPLLNISYYLSLGISLISTIIGFLILKRIKLKT